MPQDAAEAAAWYRLAAEQGDASAQNFLGLMYYAGGRGVPQDACRSGRLVPPSRRAGRRQLRRTSSG